ncbi:MAG: histidinol dehydrogenase [Flavihumibacter sp.]|nr:histidinol dehydrogenase [Flavihumibacter sp.]
MNLVKYPAQKEWEALLKRPAFDNTALEQKVKVIMGYVKLEGDVAVKRYTQQFDGAILQELKVSTEEIAAAVARIPDGLKQAIATAKNNIETFHRQQLQEPVVIATMPGVECWRKNLGIEKVGLYIPGGTAPLFSTLLMLGIPAKLAGCKEIVLCSPPNKDGQLHDAILYAAQLVGVTNIYKCGGVQAIAAMTYGTATIPKVHKLFGPGNQYVTAAKQLAVKDGLAIDMPAGPSEVAVLADETAVPAFVAADLLSQAEHGADSQVILVTTSEAVVTAVQNELDKQLAVLPRKELATQALANSKAIVVNNIDEAINLLNSYAAEHLIISCANASEVGERVLNAGSVFIGNYSPESVGDYASGTNHTLPTNGYAAMYSGVSVDSFVKKITYQKLSKEGLNAIAATVITMAEAEGLEAHANAVRVRTEN